MTEYFLYIRGLKPSDKPDYSRLNKLFRSMLSASGPGKVLRYDWVERAYKHIELIHKKYIAQKNSSEPTKDQSDADPKAQLGAIDLDNDKNFNVPDDDCDEDDESNLDDTYASEMVGLGQDALTKSIVRIQEQFSSQFIKDMPLKANSAPLMKTSK
jgi:hypothetical protein